MARPTPRLIAITDVAHYGASRTLEAFANLCREALPGSVCVQLRWEVSPWELLRFGVQLARVCAANEQHLCVNERVDVALALGVGAAHLKASSVGALEARQLWEARGAEVWLSRAWHPSDDTLPSGVDALLVSPVCAARKGREPLGFDGLRAATARAGEIPVYALGGVDGSNVAPIVAAGARGVAAIGACYGDIAPLLRGLGITRRN
jgi:thiamine-phosphate pyrophosphorylase